MKNMHARAVGPEGIDDAGQAATITPAASCGVVTDAASAGHFDKGFPNPSAPDAEPCKRDANGKPPFAGPTVRIAMALAGNAKNTEPGDTGTSHTVSNGTESTHTESTHTGSAHTGSTGSRSSHAEFNDCGAEHVGNGASAEEVTKQLKFLVRRQDARLSRILDVLVRFDDLEGWRSSGARHCPAWMNAELGISAKLGFEYLRVGRSLQSLPIIKALFEQGILSWTKVRALTRIADADNEQLLAAAAIDATASGTERLCDDYRWAKTQEDLDAEDERAKAQFQRRSLTWRKNLCGNLVLRLELTPEHSAAFLKSIARCEDRLFEDSEGLLRQDSAPAVEPNEQENQPGLSCSASQLRADAAVLMAETSLAAEDVDIAAADRYQVIVNVDLDSLRNDSARDNCSDTANSECNGTSKDECSGTTNSECNGTSKDERSDTTTNECKDTRKDKGSDPDKAEAVSCPDVRTLPPRRASIEGIGAIGANTARRLACDASIVSLTSDKGEPLSIGRKTRVHSPAIRRAVLARDSHCQFTGCDCTRHLHLHHIVHWADGGETSVENTLAICPFHHRLVHEHGYTITRVPEHERYSMLSGIEDEHGRALAIQLGALGRRFRFDKPTSCHAEPACHSEPTCHAKPTHHAEPAYHTEPTHHAETTCHAESTYHTEPTHHAEPNHHAETTCHAESTHVDSINVDCVAYGGQINTRNTNSPDALDNQVCEPTVPYATARQVTLQDYRKKYRACCETRTLKHAACHTTSHTEVRRRVLA